MNCSCKEQRFRWIQLGSKPSCSEEGCSGHSNGTANFIHVSHSVCHKTSAYILHFNPRETMTDTVNLSTPNIVGFMVKHWSNVLHLLSCVHPVHTWCEVFVIAGSWFGFVCHFCDISETIQRGCCVLWWVNSHSKYNFNEFSVHSCSLSSNTWRQSGNTAEIITVQMQYTSPYSVDKDLEQWLSLQVSRCTALTEGGWGHRVCCIHSSTK